MRESSRRRWRWGLAVDGLVRSVSHCVGRTLHLFVLFVVVTVVVVIVLFAFLSIECRDLAVIILKAMSTASTAVPSVPPMPPAPRLGHAGPLVAGPSLGVVEWEAVSEVGPEASSGVGVVYTSASSHGCMRSK